jgi:xylulokinase
MGVEGSFVFPKSDAQVIPPDPVISAKYNQRYENYLKLSQHLRLFGGEES